MRSGGGCRGLWEVKWEGQWTRKVGRAIEKGSRKDSGRIEKGTKLEGK
jgi:hypothetical protein